MQSLHPSLLCSACSRLALLIIPSHTAPVTRASLSPQDASPLHLRVHKSQLTTARRYWVNDGPKLIIILIFLLANIALFLERFFYYWKGGGKAVRIRSMTAFNVLHAR